MTHEEFEQLIKNHIVFADIINRLKAQVSDEAAEQYGKLSYGKLSRDNEALKSVIEQLCNHIGYLNKKLK